MPGAIFLLCGVISVAGVTGLILFGHWPRRIGGGGGQRWRAAVAGGGGSRRLSRACSVSFSIASFTYPPTGKREGKELPPVPLKTYQWEDLRRAREAGAYPWTHLLKPPLQGEVTAEDVLRESTPRRSMSRDVSRSRTRSPADRDEQRILHLDSSPGSSRRHGEEGTDEGIHIPNFSKEISLDSEDDAIKQAVDMCKPDTQSTSQLATPLQIPKNISPKSILKRRGNEQQYIGITESREKTKCCHPLVNKIKHLADKTLHKLERNDHEKSPQTKRKKNEPADQEIRQLKSSPGTARRQKFSAIKLGDSDEMSKTMSIDSTPPPQQKKEHIYEDIEEAKAQGEKSLHFSLEVEDRTAEKREQDNVSNKETDSILERKSIASYDPSLVAEENNELNPDDHIMEKLHKVDDVNKEAILLDDDPDTEPNVDEIFLNQLEETRPKIIQKESSPNITITEIEDDSAVQGIEQTSEYRIESSPSPQAFSTDKSTIAADVSGDWSKTNSDHEYEIIEKPHPDIIYTAPSVEGRPTMGKTDDELSSTTSLERKCLQVADEDEQMDDKEHYNDDKDDDIARAEALQKTIEDRFFVNTPSTVSRTECEVSTSQVDSSALENLPLKRDSRQKNAESLDHKIQQRIKEGTGKLKTQAGRLKTKLQNMKASMPDKPKINFPDRSKFKMPERPKFNMPDRPKFTLPDRRKFSLPDRPKFKKINISEKLSLGDRKKFTLPERPKFNVPDMPKFKMPDRPKINFPSLGRKKEYKIDTISTESSSDVRNVATVEYETKTYPRLFNRKKKTIKRTSSSPTLEREDTPPPVFTFTRVKKTTVTTGPQTISPVPQTENPEQQPREYGSIDDNENFNSHLRGTKSFEETYDFDKPIDGYIEEDIEQTNEHDRDTASIPEDAPSKQEYSHINEIDNDEFFVRPRGISRENIQVREYLSDEIRQAFKIPKNSLAMMGSTSNAPDDHMYDNDVEADPELFEDNDPPRYSNEDANEKDDGYYTFPPVRPSRAKRKKKDLEGVQYIDDSVTASMQFSDVDLDLEDQTEDHNHMDGEIQHTAYDNEEMFLQSNGGTNVELQHEYANDAMYEYSDNMQVQSQTLPMPPRRKKKSLKSGNYMHSSLNDFREMPPQECQWKESVTPSEDVIVYRTEHEYVIPRTETAVTEGSRSRSPAAPRRTRSRSSRGTSLCDDDRTSHGAESLTLDTHQQPDEEPTRRESPGYATVDKSPAKATRRSHSRTPPVRPRKSHSSERKYYTVSSNRDPDRPPRKKSSTSLVTLESITKRSTSTDVTQYVEIDEPRFEETHKGLISGDVISKMKDRPLPPPPRPPRGSKRTKRDKNEPEWKISTESQLASSASAPDEARPEEVVEIEVSTQTDPLPDDVDYELGMDENIDVSMSSSLKDIIDETSITKSYSKLAESPRVSRPTSRSEKSFKLSDPKISELSKSTIGRTSPTVILVERRVSSPTRINERQEMLTEASLTVQHIDVEEADVAALPPLPTPRVAAAARAAPRPVAPAADERALELKVSDTNREVQLDNLVTQRLQVRDLDVGRLNVSELQANKILVSDIEGMTLQVTELDSKAGHISVSGIEFSQTVIDEIVKKFAEISTSTAATVQQHDALEQVRPLSRSEETQTDQGPEAEAGTEATQGAEEAPQRPPPPDLTPLLYTYLQDLTLPPASLLHARAQRDRPFTEFHESQPQPPPPQRRAKRKAAATAPQSESSSDGGPPPPSPRRMPPPTRTHEPSIAEAGAQFIRVCHSSISRTLRGMFHSLMSYISGTEDKRDVQMALVIFLVLVAGLIMFGLSDSRTIHHHHWEFFNPPEGKPT